MFEGLFAAKEQRYLSLVVDSICLQGCLAFQYERRTVSFKGLLQTKHYLHPYRLRLQPIQRCPRNVWPTLARAQSRAFSCHIQVSVVKNARRRCVKIIHVEFYPNAKLGFEINKSSIVYEVLHTTK